MGTILIIILVLLLLGAPPDMALQRQLGLLPERRTGTGSADRGDSGANRPVLTLKSRSDSVGGRGENRSFVTLLRVTFHQALGHNDQCQNLGPL